MNEKKGKPKFPPTVEEQETIVTLAASGLSQTKIAQTVGRSRSLVKNVMASPEIQRAVKDERQELAVMYRGKARDVLVSIDAETIAKGNLLQKATSSAILLDKSLLLAGEPTGITMLALLDVVEAIKASKQGRLIPAPQMPTLLPAPPE
jgi:hypothetical protein